MCVTMNLLEYPSLPNTYIAIREIVGIHVLYLRMIAGELCSYSYFLVYTNNVASFAHAKIKNKVY